MTTSFAELLDNHDAPQLPKVSDTVEGKVISVSSTEVHLDINGVATGVIRGRELFDESGEYSNLKIGDTARATVLELENEYGEMELSFGQAGHRKAWDELYRLMKEKMVLDIPVVEANKGGLMVRVNRVVGFLPVSQLTPEHYPRVEGGDKNRILELLQRFVGTSLRAKVIDVNEIEEKLIVSEKAAWEEKQHEILSGFEVGQVVSGKVTGIVDFGCFVEFGQGLEGLVHISELAWQRVDNPHDFIKVGDHVDAKIIGIEGTKISLSIKKLVEDPWNKAVEKYSVGQVVKGKVIKLNPYGAFVQLDPQIQGLAHISELSDKRITSPADVVKEGDDMKFKILSIEPTEHRLGLSLKALHAKVPKEDKEEKEETPKAEGEKAEPQSTDDKQEKAA
jgi:small subunit ribosomal protein S1